MKDPLLFDPEILFDHLNRSTTRDAIASWLSGGPETFDGEKIIAIRQAMTVEPTHETRAEHGGQDVILCGFDKCAVRINSITPVISRLHPAIGPDIKVHDVWEHECTSYHFLGFREPYFLLAHDETYLRLVNSKLTVMTEFFGSHIDLIHFAHGTLMISDADPARLIAPTFEGMTWQGGACTAIFPPADSQHAKIQQSATILQMNTHLQAFFNKKNASRASPRDLRLTAAN